MYCLIINFVDSLKLKQSAIIVYRRNKKTRDKENSINKLKYAQMGNQSYIYQCDFCCLLMRNWFLNSMLCAGQCHPHIMKQPNLKSVPRSCFYLEHVGECLFTEVGTPLGSDILLPCIHCFLAPPIIDFSTPRGC